ncbi:MAG TPA: 30S ribosomal protein S13 [candidate division WWE3 bacterium]|uniref:Small ribosomal subunit protein uS13 n=1 Tax=candidate division WWE3 bacterium TaxID=2053526 RepID=A0A7C1DP28_UNCKA|nr:30S ribosomal protein S13 [candidate division WWE3 bacterium]
MARIAGIEIPDNKKAKISLTYVRGIGRSNVLEILKKAGVDPEIRIKELDENAIAKLNKAIESLAVPIEGELRRMVRQDIQRLVDIGSYRGLRHKMGLPTRGQRTSHNARTAKGKKKTVGGLKRKLSKT